MHYPSERDLRGVVRALAALPGNHFTPQEVLARGHSGSSSTCAMVRELPPPRADGLGALYFGFDADGYVIVAPHSSRRGWPLTPQGTPAPVRLHRWIGGVGAGLHARHACDNAACIARAHLQAGSARENLADQYVRRRRAAPRSAGLRRQRGRPQDSPQPPSARLGAPKEAREARFCMTGFDSPAKRARALRRAAAAAPEPIAFEA